MATLNPATGVTRHATDLEGVWLLEPKAFGDPRGFFAELFRAADYQALGLPPMVQDNHSRSRFGVLRGLHYQLQQPQGKLVYVARGAIFDVAVDIRRGSPTFGRSVSATLNDANHHQLYIPPGFAHGFCVLSPEADVIYKCTDYYHAPSERGLAWNDPELAIPWPLAADQVTLSAKDRAHPTVAVISPEALPSYDPGALG